jgi:rhamnogalacturonyl hydrolase YesR
LNNTIALAVAPLHPPQDAALLAKKKEAASYFSNWPEGKAPEAVGFRLIEDFLGRDMPRTRRVACPEVLAWTGGLKLTRAPGNQTLNDRLVQKALYLTSDEGQKTFGNDSRPEMRALGALLAEVYLQTRQWRFQLYAGRMADAQWGKPEAGGLTREARYWADDLFLIGLLQAQAYRTTGKQAYRDHCGLLAKAYLEKLQQSNGRLLHSVDSLLAWGRANGMAAAGLTEILRVLPEDHPDRPAIMAGYQKLMQALRECQGANGLWKQVIDKPESWDETSGSGLIAYAMVTGVKEGCLDAATYGPAARRAWLALVDCIDENGRTRDVCTETVPAAKQAGSSQPEQYTYYLERPRATGDLYGQASVLWAGCALLRN